MFNKEGVDQYQVWTRRLLRICIPAITDWRLLHQRPVDIVIEMSIFQDDRELSSFVTTRPRPAFGRLGLGGLLGGKGSYG